MPYSSRSWNSTTHRNEKSVSELIHGAMKANSSFGAEKATDELYEVEKIVSYKIRQGKGYYRIRWKGYGKDSDTWVPEESMNCPLLIQEYHKRQIYEIGYCPQTLLDLLRVHSWTIIFRILLQLAHCRCFCAAGCLFWWFWHRFLFKIENETILQLFWRQSRCAMKLVHIIVILAIYGDVTMPLSWLVDCRGRNETLYIWYCLVIECLIRSVLRKWLQQMWEMFICRVSPNRQYSNIRVTLPLHIQWRNRGSPDGRPHHCVIVDKWPHRWYHSFRHEHMH